MKQRAMTATQEKAATSIPILENGDHLTRHEFERRYPFQFQLNNPEFQHNSHESETANCLLWVC
jgi:hypothetical protein